MLPPTRRTRRTSLALGLALTISLLIGALGAAPASAKSWPGHPDRNIVTHVVRKGDTVTGLAVRYHAWTRELIALNHLSGSRVYIGERLRIPVVVSRAAGHRPSKHPVRKHHKPSHVKPAPMPASKAAVRTIITRTAVRHRVPSDLALAIGWQESGWRQNVTSSAGAIGVMQLMPSTGVWMSQYAGRRLKISRSTQDNVTGGVMLLSWLRANTRRNSNAIAAYYQGLGAVQRHGWYDDTHRYVKSVRAIQRSLRHTGHP